MKDIALEGDLLSLYCFAKVETNVSMEDCGSSSTESEYWAEYLTKFPEESSFASSDINGWDFLRRK